MAGRRRGAREAICERLRGDLKVCPTVRLASVKEIQALGQSAEYRKQRVFLDRREGRCAGQAGGQAGGWMDLR